MNLNQDILINQYGQNLVLIEALVDGYKRLNPIDRKMYLHHLITLIIQSKSEDMDIPQAIENSYLKKTFTPCVLLKNGGVKYHNLKKIIELPDHELEKALVLLLNLFKIGYNRRFQKEKDNPDKWWYWDLSNEKNIDVIEQIAKS
ncbi:DUF5958 family protein [uncultured Bacteroides sp.]|uniref:DUF5958 family protein n=1 Tax=uncultured Bacteroides sp. TaxID=162156 RepID=UPI0025DD11F2|nr:DUF5958 family protein [uncultured Bacteroides sp.]